MTHNEPSTVLLRRAFTKKTESKKEALDSLFNSIRRNWIPLTSLMENGQILSAVELLNTLRPKLEKVGYFSLSKEIEYFSFYVKTNLLTAEAAKIKFDMLSREIALTRSKIKTELNNF